MTYEWKNYSSKLEYQKNGVGAGDGVFVGGGTHPSGDSGPTSLFLKSRTCYFPWGTEAFKLSGCVYLVDQPGNFKWIKSKNGVVVQGAVEYKGIPVGRVRHNGRDMRVGKITVDYRIIFYPFRLREYNASAFEVLVFKTHRN